MHLIVEHIHYDFKANVENGMEGKVREKQFYGRRICMSREYGITTFHALS